MTTLFDFSAIKSGGGVQLARNFLDFIATSYVSDFSVVLPPTGELTSYATAFQGQVASSPLSAMGRLNFEYRDLQHFIRLNDVTKIYTFFGSGLPKPPTVTSIVNVAYPIICYPDSPFWRNIPLAFRFRQELKNVVRRARLRSANRIIAETHTMRTRLATSLNIGKNRIEVMPPSPSMYLMERPFVRRSSPELQILILGGLSPHKNVWRVGQIVRVLLERGFNQFKFLVSCRRDDFVAVQALPLTSTELDRHFNFLGSVPVDQIDTIYRSADVLLNISDLESFSNNYMESWKAGVALICSDRDFAREICGESALYAEPHAPELVADAIQRVAASELLREELISRGKERLRELPTSEERHQSIVALVGA